jgi:hypothetical protein
VWQERTDSVQLYQLKVVNLGVKVLTLEKEKRIILE